MAAAFEPGRLRDCSWKISLVKTGGIHENNFWTVMDLQFVMCPIKLSTRDISDRGKRKEGSKFWNVEDVIGRYVKGATRISH